MATRKILGNLHKAIFKKKTIAIQGDRPHTKVGIGNNLEWLWLFLFRPKTLIKCSWISPRLARLCQDDFQPFQL